MFFVNYDPLLLPLNPVLYLHEKIKIRLDYSQFLFVGCYSMLLSVFGLALTLRHRASGIPDLSLVLNIGIGSVVVYAIAYLTELNIYWAPFLALPVGCAVGARMHLLGALNYFRFDKRRALKILVIVIVLLFATMWAAYLKVVENEKAG